MEVLTVPKYNDFWWDRAEPAERNDIVLKEQAIPTALFAKEQVPFYREHYKRLSLQDIQKITSFEEFSHIIPYITKEHLAANHPKAFLPEISEYEIDPNRGRYWMFGTGGTTGKPVLVFHSMEDWRGMSITANRHIEFDFYHDESIAGNFPFKRGTFLFEGLESRLTPLMKARIVGAYNADHITNNIYANMLHRLGSEFYWRPSAAPALEDIYDSTQSFRANGLLAPPDGGNDRKGAFLRAILEQDARKADSSVWDLSHRFNHDFKFIFWSSMPISEELLGYLREDLRMPYIKGHFGSTEVCPTAATCSCHPRKFHLVFGHSLVVLKSLNGIDPVNPDELGYMLVSKIGATNRSGQNILPTGMIFLNYMTGDAARLSKEIRCECGRNTPVLYDIQRIEFNEERLGTVAR